jgi:hypothetical protein
MIRILIPLCALLAQTPSPRPSPAPASTPATPPAAEAPAAPAPQVEPWPGTFAEGFAAIRKHAGDNQFESARLIADRLLAPNGFLRWKNELAAQGGFRSHLVGALQPTIDWLALDGLDADARAEVWFARGVVDTLAKMRPEAEADFEAARAGANDRALRHDAIYDLGSLSLSEGEEIRATIPEISGKPPAPPPPVPPPAAAGAGAPATPPDPIQLARAAYLKARGHFVERLRSDWRDDDTQANVELCLKRLRELDEIEKKREEEKKKQEEQQKKDQNDKDQQQDKDKDKDKQDQKDPNQKSDKNDSKDDPKPKDQKPEDEQKPKPPDEKKPEDKPDQKKPDEKKDAPPEDQKEAQMSREEMTQLLDRLQQLEDEAKKIQAQLKAARRGKVKKDW